jgi:hypothetical protein
MPSRFDERPSSEEPGRVLAFPDEAVKRLPVVAYCPLFPAIVLS